MLTIRDWMLAQSTDRKSQPYPHAGINPQIARQFDDHRQYDATVNNAQNMIIRGKDTTFLDKDPRDGHIRTRQANRSFDHESTKQLLSSDEIKKGQS